jgi:hypothetical protein
MHSASLHLWRQPHLVACLPFICFAPPCLLCPTPAVPVLASAQVHVLQDSHEEAEFIAEDIQRMLFRWLGEGVQGWAALAGSTAGCRLLAALQPKELAQCVLWTSPVHRTGYVPLTLAGRLVALPACTCLPACSQQHPEEQIAVLFRTHVQARLVEQELVRGWVALPACLLPAGLHSCPASLVLESLSQPKKCLTNALPLPPLPLLTLAAARRCSATLRMCWWAGCPSGGVWKSRQAST